MASQNRLCEDTVADPTRTNTKSHIPGNSTLFEKVIPALLILMGIVMIVLILFAAGVLLGFIHF
jgi:hypothetical protein